MRIYFFIVASLLTFCVYGMLFCGLAVADKKLFTNQCGICHVYDSSGDSGGRTGPNLHGILGRVAGSVVDFENYSEALSQSGVVWTRETLDLWLENPKSVIPGTYMVYKQRKPEVRASIIDYIAGR